MNKKIILIAAVVLLLAAAGGYFLVVRRSEGESYQPPTANGNQSTYAGSEQPNNAKFDEYLRSVYLGKLPVGQDLGPGIVPQVTLVFQEGDQFCTVLEPKKTIGAGAYASAIYDLNAKEYIKPKVAFPGSFDLGTNVGCGDIPVPAGKYEYKAYLNNTLVAVIPFEVK